MIEVGGIYKLKKLNLPYIHNDNDSYEILYEINSNIVACINTSTRERMVLQKQFFIDPEKPDEDSFEGMTIEPTILEEFGGGMAVASAGSAGGAIGGMASLGAAPCPTMAQASNGVSGAMVNGIPVEGQSAMKKKKKKKKKHETSAVQEGYEKDLEYYDTSSISHVSPDEMIEKVEDTFEPNETLITYVASPRERLKITVKYSGETLTHVLEIAFLNEANDVIDSIYEEDLTTMELIETLQEIFSRHHEIESLREDFNEEYEEITEQIAKYLDRLNFQYANTTDIVYKKEGDYKYLFKFDNEIGIIKIKVLKGDEVLVEKTYEIDETQDVQPIFDEIESIYQQYGV